jgi:pimeloyl-ACP methyl ester carboxylesterase
MQAGARFMRSGLEKAVTAPAVIRYLQYLTVPSGIRLHYASAGERHKPLILFVHGFPEFWFAWEAQLAYFGQTHLAVAPDLRGFNLSSKPQSVDDYRPALIVEDLVELVRGLGYEKCIVVAHDWGGAICWNLAMQYPDMVEQLIIINAPHPWLFAQALITDPAQQAASAYMNWLRRPGSEDALTQNDFTLLRGFFTDRDKRPASWLSGTTLEKYEAAWSQPGDGDSHPLTGSVNYYRASPMRPPMRGEAALDLSRLDPSRFIVHVPTLVIWADQDRALPATLLDGLDAFVPELRVERIAGATHWVVHEHPERINLLIRSAVPCAPCVLPALAGGIEV